GEISATPALTVDSSGNAIALWRGLDTNDAIRAARRLKSSNSWSTPVTISNTTRDASIPKVAANSSGTAYAVWVETDTLSSVYFAKYIAETETWTPGVQISGVGVSASFPEIAVSPSGKVAAAWAQVDGTAIKLFASVYGDGSWSTPVAIDTLTISGFYNFSMGIDDEGNATLAWTNGDLSVFDIFVSTYKVSDSAWSSRQNLSSPTTHNNAAYPIVSVNKTGRMAIVYRQEIAADILAVVRTRTAANASFATAVNLSAVGADTETVTVHVDKAGDAIALWTRSDGANWIAQASRFDFGAGIWSAAVDLSAAGQDAFNPKLGANSFGSFTAVWDRSDGANQIVQSTDYDDQGPLFSSVTIPESTIVTIPTTFSAASTDYLSGVVGGDPQWDFGDGNTGSGSPVTHTYTVAGTYTVTLTTTDNLGNVTQKTQSIFVDILSAPIVSVIPEVVGSARIGRTLFCRVGVWTGTRPTIFSYQWQTVSGSSVKNLSGRTAATYTVRKADRKKRIRCRVTATNQFGTASVNSASTSKVR
ncbi:PKD domain-containing protein, partial [bacterium]|nr:PKD domain-containing protein [bacterium]